MYPVVHMSCDLSKVYNNNTLFTKIKDRFILSLQSQSLIKELGLTINEVRFPSNFHKEAYRRNIERARKLAKSKRTMISPKTLRVFDYSVLNQFQKDLIAYSVVKSIQLMLRVRNKSIKDSCILIYDAIDKINSSIIYELCKSAKFLILLSKEVARLEKISDYVIANYGVSPIITNDFRYAFRLADFIISSRAEEIPSSKPIWYLDNGYNPVGKNGIVINDIEYKVPWSNNKYSSMSPELLGAILSQMEEKDVQKSLKYNGIYLDSIKFNDKIVSSDQAVLTR